MELISKNHFHSLLEKSSVLETLLDFSASLVPFWLAILIGLIVGWAWKPRWVSLLFLGLRSRPRLLWTTPPGFGARRIWFAMTAFTTFQMLKECWLSFRAWRWPKNQLVQSTSNSGALSSQEHVEYRSSGAPNLARSVIGDDDLRALHSRLKYKDAEVPWELMMERVASGMSYKAWRRDPQGGPTEYRSRTVFEDATPEMVKDFYWDDEFRSKWDDMLIYTKSLEVCTETGSEVAHWVRKFPFFCSDREYLIGRRIYMSGGTYFCITKGVPYSAIPRQNKPRRVDVYYSSWCIRAVESTKGNGQLSACEVTFFHSEDMGIPRDIAKFGVRQGMWGCVRKMEPGLRKYQALRKSAEPLSHSAQMAQIITKVPPTFFEDTAASISTEVSNVDSGKGGHVNSWKWIIVGGAVILACGLDRGVVGKVLVFGVARRLSKLSGKM